MASEATLTVLRCVLDHLFGTDEGNDDKITCFHTSTLPSIKPSQYLMRIASYTQCDSETLVMALVHINRILYNDSSFQVTALNIHRLLITGVLCASKFHQDTFYNNKVFAKVGGVSLKELNRLEYEYLQLLNYELFVDGDSYREFVKDLCNPHTLHQHCSCSHKILHEVQLEAAANLTAKFSIPPTSDLLAPKSPPAPETSSSGSTTSSPLSSSSRSAARSSFARSQSCTSLLEHSDISSEREESESPSITHSLSKLSMSASRSRSKKNALSKLVSMNSEEDEDDPEGDCEDDTGGIVSIDVSGTQLPTKHAEEEDLDAAFASIAWMPQKSSHQSEISTSPINIQISAVKTLDSKSNKKSISSVREFVEDIDERRKLSQLYNKLSATAAAALECTNLL